MTEEEAKTKFCPHVSFDPHAEKKCITSDCMMWVWDTSPREAAAMAAQYDTSALRPMPNGHCGLRRG